MDTCLRSNATAGPFSSQPSGLRVFWLAALSLIGRRPQRVFSLFASRIQPKYAAAPLNQSRTWCTSVRPPAGYAASRDRRPPSPDQSLMAVIDLEGCSPLQPGTNKGPILGAYFPE